MAYYLDNDKFRQALLDFKLSRDAANGAHVEIPRYVGESILAIATNMARRPNFSRYSWKDDMIGDAIETCVKYVDRYDPTRGTSALSYFSQIVWYSFIGRIALEKKQSKIKREIVRYAGVDTFDLQGHDDTGEFQINLQEFLSSIGDEPEPEVKKKKIKEVVDPFEGFEE